MIKRAFPNSEFVVVKIQWNSSAITIFSFLSLAVGAVVVVVAEIDLASALLPHFANKLYVWNHFLFFGTQN